jgi:hypothetical protein
LYLDHSAHYDVLLTPPWQKQLNDGCNDAMLRLILLCWTTPPADGFIQPRGRISNEPQWVAPRSNAQMPLEG